MDNKGCVLVNKHVMLQCSLFSHFDTNVYTADQVLALSLRCKEMGASAIHVHINKLGTVEEFLRLAKLLDRYNGPFLNISANDANAIMGRNVRNLQSIVCSAMQGGNANVFDNIISQSLEQAISAMAEIIERGLIPEVCVFNYESVRNCQELQKLFPSKFLVGVYLGYPGELPATQDTIKNILQQLKACAFVSFTLYNNQCDFLTRSIIDGGGNIRIGLEDSVYCGTKIADSIFEMIDYTTNIVKNNNSDIQVYSSTQFKSFFC